jgi:hypothetical protein
MLGQQGDTITGSPTCARVTYFTVVSGKIVSSDDIREILLARHVAGISIEINHDAISHLLHDGFVPPPLTVYRGIFGISVDLSATLNGSELSFSRDFPFENRKSPLDGTPSTRTLLAALAGSVERACRGASDAMLLLSAGVDSTSVAVAAKEAGLENLVCVTHGESETDFEVNFARATCRRLGLRHEAHITQENHAALQDRLATYGAAVAEPCTDPALIACISSVAQFGAPRGRILDGSGSDYFFWRPPRRADLLKTWLGLGRFRVFRDMRRFIPMHYRRERLFATPLELLLLHGAWPRYSETRRFYSEVRNTHEFWLREFRDGYRYNREEIQHCLKMVYMGPAAFMLKTRNASTAIGAQACFPWTDEAVAEYCFRLPESSRFNRSHRKSKTIVRQMLAETVGYDGDAVGKRHFSFGKHRFVRANLAFCREEIVACQLWSLEVGATFDQLASQMARGLPTENAILSLFAVSLWHNRWVMGGMSEWLATNTGHRDCASPSERSRPERSLSQDNTSPVRREAQAVACR